MALPPLSSVAEIHARLQEVFPEGTPNRNNCVWEIAASTVFVMLYIGAVEGTDRWLRPDQVTRMTNDQADTLDEAARLQWAKDSIKPQRGEIPGRWYAVNTRESIRDDTLRGGLISNGAVIERKGLPTTSPAPRYALRADFAALFDPDLEGEDLAQAIHEWGENNLSAGARARVAILRRGAAQGGGESVKVTFPNEETRHMAPGPSSIISKAVIEDFAPRFLENPGVIFLSESRDKVVARDDDLAQDIGLHIQADKNLPDIVLVDLGPKHPLLVFIEVVATDGPVNENRKTALLELSKQAGFPPEHVAFVTAYLDRSGAPFKKTVDNLAWNSFAWFVSEPESFISLWDTSIAPTFLHQLMR